MYRLDTKENELIEIEETSFSDQGLKETENIEQWILKKPEILGEKLFVITSQLRFHTGIKLDILAIDRKGNTVIIETKRDTSHKHLDWQAVKYASHVSKLSAEKLINEYALQSDTSPDDAKIEILDFLELSGTDEQKIELINKKQRIMLVTKEYTQDVILASDWLLSHGVDVTCFTLTPYQTENGDIFIVPDQIIPVKGVIESQSNFDVTEDKVASSTGLSGANFSLEESNYSKDKLIELLTELLTKPSKQRDRLKDFFSILVDSDTDLERKIFKDSFTTKGLSKDFTQAGRHLSNISQLITNKNNPFLRQILDFNSKERPGAKKESYKLKNEYIPLVKEILNSIESNLKKAA